MKSEVTKMRQTLMSLALVANLAFAVSVATAESYDLENSSSEGIAAEVAVRLEVTGHLKLNADGSKVRELPLEVTGDLRYSERMHVADQQVRAVRYYDQADAMIKVADAKRRSRLSPKRRLIAIEKRGKKPIFFAPGANLTREELDLLDVPANSALLVDMLPQGKVDVGDVWEHSTDDMTAFFALDAVSFTDVKSKLDSVKDGRAKIALSGQLTGAIGGVATEIEVEGNYQYDFADKTIRRLQLSVKEDRAIGHAAPGLRVVATLRLETKSIETPLRISDAALQHKKLKLTHQGELLHFASAHGEFQVLHDRRWQTMTDLPHVTILRLVDRGDLIAQCNITKLADLPRGEHLELEQFQADVHRALGDNFHQFAEASQEVTDGGHRILRVVALGTASELPIQWTCYHITSAEGRRVSCTFTMDATLAERFAASDRQLISTIDFLPRQAASAKRTSEPIETR